ncbi:MAG TPA: hypothetical protein DDW50_22360 [Firmicutes bacterium]|nr:hypothetical protein [Bacillota bacterium]
MDNKISPALTDEVYHQDLELYRSVINNISEFVCISAIGLFLFSNRSKRLSKKYLKSIKYTIYSAAE